MVNTSFLYFFIDSFIVSPISEYLLQNRGELSDIPSISFVTRTCPDVFGPDPIPIVGIDILFVISSAIGSGTHSITNEKHPAFSRHIASFKIFKAYSEFFP